MFWRRQINSIWHTYLVPSRQFNHIESSLAWGRHTMSVETDLLKEQSDTVCLFFIVDGPKLEAQAILLAATLRFFNADRYRLIAYIPKKRRVEIQRITWRMLGACNVEIRTLPAPKVNDRTPFTQPYPHGNKILAAADSRPDQISVFLDSDMVCCAPLDLEALVQPGTMRAVVSDYATGWYRQKRWIMAYKHFGHALPEQRVKFHRGRQLSSPPYFNAGLVGFREDVASDAEHLGKVWLDTANKFDWDTSLKYERVFMDQLTLPIAATRAGLTMPLTQTDYNYNIMRRPFNPDLSPRILHYHRFKDLWNWPFGQHIPEILHGVAGAYLTRRTLSVFRKHYSMPANFEKTAPFSQPLSSNPLSHRREDGAVRED
jgi:hypothetical protein